MVPQIVLQMCILAAIHFRPFADLPKTSRSPDVGADAMEMNLVRTPQHLPVAIRGVRHAGFETAPAD